MANKVQTGLLGQNEALKFLLARGMTLKEANFRAPGAEIDLIMKDGLYIVFVEVKYRQKNKFGLPREAVDSRKQKKIKKAALHYIARHSLQNQDFRFDVVELLGSEVNHIENAFW